MGIIWCLRRFLTSVCILLLISILDQTAIASEVYYQTHFLFHLVNNTRIDITIKNLALLRRENTLLYSYEELEDGEHLVKVGFVSLNGFESGKSGDIEHRHRHGHGHVLPEPSIVSVPNMRFHIGAIGIDQESSIVYLGDTGIFQFDVYMDKVSYFGNFNITAVFYRNGLYFASQNKIYYNPENSKPKRLLNSLTLIKTFLIANDGTIVYVNSEGVMAYRENESIVLSNNTNVRFAIDLNEKVFAHDDHEIYKLVLASVFNKSKMVMIGNFHHEIGSITFDNNNTILYTSQNDIYRITPTDCGKNVTDECIFEVD